MRHYPIFLDTKNRRVVLCGGGDAALAKLRLLLKTESRLHVFAPTPAPEIEGWARDTRLTLHRRDMQPCDLIGAALVYAADEHDTRDARTKRLAGAAGVLFNWVDNLDASEFITPALVDRDPVTVAIGTEGTAPVLARAIKADLEARLPQGLGALARLANGFRARAFALPPGRARRSFWQAFFFRDGPRAQANGPDAVNARLDALLDAHLKQAPEPGHVAFVGAGPGDPDLLTLKARKALDAADVVLHDRLVPQAILELARREATLIEVGKTPFGPAMPQDKITALIVEHAQSGAHVVRLKGGDPVLFARLDEETDALAAAGIAYSVVPGITAASASAAALGVSLTRRGRNAGLRILSAQDANGLADHDWRAMARHGEVSAIYMGKRAAHFVAGRLMMHGAAPDTPVSVVADASRPTETRLPSTLSALSADLAAAAPDGPALILIGVAPRRIAPAQQEVS